MLSCYLAFVLECAGLQPRVVDEAYAFHTAYDKARLVRIEYGKHRSYWERQVDDLLLVYGSWDLEYQRSKEQLKYVEWAYGCWDCLEDALVEGKPESERVERLIKLRQLLGPIDWWNRTMPTPLYPLSGDGVGNTDEGQ